MYTNLAGKATDHQKAFHRYMQTREKKANPCVHNIQRADIAVKTV